MSLYRKEFGGSGTSGRGQESFSDGWMIWKKGESDESPDLIVVVDTETLADAIIGFLEPAEPDDPIATDKGYDAFLNDATHQVAGMWHDRGGRLLTSEELYQLYDLLTGFFDGKINAPKATATCPACGAAEKITDLGGVKVSNLAPYSKLCIACITKEENHELIA
jgi:hypothetical protein